MTILPGPDLTGDPLLATELADYLSAKGVPFREAHNIVGQIVQHCELENIGLEALSLKDLVGFHTSFDNDVFAWLDPSQAAERRTSRGGTAWPEVQRQIVQLRSLLDIVVQ